MLFTRSIRQKLISGLCLVVALVALSMYCSLIGVRSVNSTVSDLELSVSKLPRKAEIMASLSLLFVPLTAEFPDPQTPVEIQQEFADRQQEQFAQVYEKVRGKFSDFTKALQTLDPRLQRSQQEQMPFRTLLISADKGLSSIQDAISGLGDLKRRDISVRVITKTASELIDTIESRLPDPAKRLGERLREAQAHNLSQQNMVIGLSAVSVLVLMILMGWCYRMIFVPIRKLFQGVRRLASGDYGYRVEVPTQCEIGKLADAFNEMSARILEDRRSKEHEIDVRSRQLVQSERLAGAGFLASGVAHEINNPLSVIMTAAYGLEMRLSDDVLDHLSAEDKADVREYLGLIQTESERCERITKKLLDFSYGKGDEKNSYDVTAIAQEVISMVSHLSRYQDRHITINRTQPLHAWVNAPEIKQVILNLVANALDATSAGGKVDIQIREFPQKIELSVQDDGVGMSAEQMKHIFEPFFTTKDIGKGTGLGLAITHRIVRDHGGTLDVTSAGPGQGCRFTLRLNKRMPQVHAA